MQWTGMTWIVIGLLVAGVAQADMTGVVARASSGAGDYSPVHAIDGRMDTRWSSNFSDDEWFELDFGEPRLVAGVRVQWETAFGERYDVQVADAGGAWHRVYSEQEGDGRTDWIYFAPTRANRLRLVGTRRGTGWGYSIWELDVLGVGDVPSAYMAGVEPGSKKAGDGAELTLDGRAESCWPAPPGATLVVEWEESIALGGVTLLWGAPFAQSYTVDALDETGAWTRVGETTKGNGGRDYLFFPATTVTALRFHFADGGSLAELQVKSAEEEATPIRTYQAAAMERPRGWYPMWLGREQEFWTITGVVEDEDESLLGETGTFEARRDGFSVMPFVLNDGHVTSWADVSCDQSLADDYLPMPSVTWTAPDWTLEVSAVSFGEAGSSATAVRYRFVNTGSSPFHGELALAVRPVQLNPTWQYGGFSPMRSVELFEAGAPSDRAAMTLHVDRHLRALLPERPSAAGAQTMAEGDVLDTVAAGGRPSAQTVVEREGKSSVLFVYTLDVAPGAVRDIVAIFPLHDSMSQEGYAVLTSSDFESLWQREAAAWHTRLDRVTIEIPESRLVQVLRSNLAYILLNQDGPWIKPGPRNYNRSWMRDGSMTSLALLRMGEREPVRRYLESFLPFVDQKGWVPWVVLPEGNPVGFERDTREGHEYDSQGEFAFLVRHYADLSGDEALARRAYPAVLRAMQYGNQLREERMTDAYRKDPKLAAYFGLLPESNSHEGYYPAMHSYWDDFWFLRGLKDAAVLATRFGTPEQASWLRALEKEFRGTLLRSMQLVMDRDGLSTLPGCVEKGDFDATSTAIAVMACDEGAALPEPAATRTFDRYYEDFEARLIPGQERSFTPYEVRTADVFVRRGLRERALKMVREFTRDSTRPYAWNHMAEVVHGRLRTPSYIGDMPHTWVGSGYINAIMSFFCYEENDRLVLGAGVDPAWLVEGIRVDGLVTAYGRLSFRARMVDGVVRVHVEGTAAPPGGFLMALGQPVHFQKLPWTGCVEVGTL
ncbi:MAG: discoidin domain-containing protein [Lentisphaerae bacterium]|nr:discoidin domain-containing protein [Lentisphaerota bacterium]